MKKVLIASTALVAATMVSAGAASASEKIKLNLGGYSKWWVVGAWQDNGFQRDTNMQPVAVDVKGDNEVYFGGSTTLDNGLQVGIDIQLEAGGENDTRAGANVNTDVIDESYVFIGGGFGKFIIGSKNNGTYLIHNTAPDAAGNWNEGGILTARTIQTATGFTHMGAIADLALHAANNGAGAPGAATASTNRTGGVGPTTAILTDGDSEGITYVSPTFAGFTFGASYKPNGLTEDARNVEGGAMPVYGAGVLYANTFGGVGIKADFGYAQYNPNRVAAPLAATAGAINNHEMQREVSTGAQVSYAGFTLGGSYRQITDDENNAALNLTGVGAAPASNTLNYAANSYDGKAWDVGLQYASGPYAVSFAYYTSKTSGLIADSDSDKFEVYQVSGKYSLGAGVDVLASVGYLKSKDELENNGTVAGVAGQPAVAKADERYENKGWAVMTGLSLAF